jgi:hypothetical protein
MSCWPQCFCFWLQQLQPPFLMGWVSHHCFPTASSLGLPVSSSMALLQVHFPRCASATSGLSHCYLPSGLDRCSGFSLMGGPGTCLCKAVHRFQVHHSDYYIEPLLLHCCPSYWRLNVIIPRCTAVALPYRPVIARGASNPWMHHGHDIIESQDEILCDIGNEHPGC